MGLKTKAKKFMNLITMERDNSYAAEQFADAVAPPEGERDLSEVGPR